MQGASLCYAPNPPQRTYWSTLSPCSPLSVLTVTVSRLGWCINLCQGIHPAQLLPIVTGGGLVVLVTRYSSLSPPLVPAQENLQ